MNAFIQAPTAPMPKLPDLQRVPTAYLSPKEVRSFNVQQMVRAMLTGDWAKAGLERAYTVASLEAMADKDHALNRGIIPPQVLARDLVAGTGSAGGFLVDTEVRGVLDSLRPIMVTRRLGAAALTGLRSNVTYARNAGTSTVTWQAAENTPAVETADFNTGQVALTPKTVTAYVEASYLFRALTADVGDAMIVRKLSIDIAAEADRAAIAGTGASGQPTGLLNTAGIGTFTGASVNYAGLLEAQTDILSANALTEGSQVGFVCRPATASLLAQRQGFSTLVPCWVGPLAEGTLVGCPAITSMNVPASTLVAGDFSQMILGEWGSGLEIRVDPYSGFLSGRWGIAASLSMDVQLAWPASFSVATSVT